MEPRDADCAIIKPIMKMKIAVVAVKRERESSLCTVCVCVKSWPHEYDSLFRYLLTSTVMTRNGFLFSVGLRHVGPHSRQHQ